MARNNKLGLVCPLLMVVAVVGGCDRAATHDDVEQLAASGPSNDARLATEMCGIKASLLGGPDPASPLTALPRAELVSWSRTTKTEGAATARIVGTAIERKWPDDIILGRCEGTIAFKYRVRWVDNGRAVVKEASFTEGPSVVR